MLNISLNLNGSVAISTAPIDFHSIVYILKRGYERVYKQCPLCNNSRTVLISDGTKKYSVPCPECSSKSVKGDPERYIDVCKYSLKKYKLRKILTSIDYAGKPVFEYEFVPCDNSHSPTIYVEATDLVSGSCASSFGSELLFFDETEARRRQRELNKGENDRIRKFLGDSVESSPTDLTIVKGE